MAEPDMTTSHDPPALTGLVSEFLEDRAADGLSHHTVASYRQTLRHFLTWLPEDTTAPDVTRRTVKRFLARRRELGEATATLGGRHASLSAFWTWLVAEEEADVNVVKKVTRPKEVKPVPLLSPAHLTALLRVQGRTAFLTARNRAILWVLVDCGLRVGELVSINTATDVDWDLRMITVRGKTGERTVPFGKTCAASLRRYLRHRVKHGKSDDPGLFIGDRGRITTGTVLVTVRKYGQLAGVGKVYPHMFRHTWVDALLREGATVLDVQYLGGWSSPQQVMTRYGIAGKRDRAILAHRKFSPGDRLSA